MASSNNMNIRTAHMEEEEGGGGGSSAHFLYPAESMRHRVSEIEEEQSSELFEINNSSGFPLDTIREEVDQGSLFSFDFHNNSGEDAIYVAIGKPSEESSSMDALLWTLTHAVHNPSTTLLFLVHVFPETKFIPMPLGMIPASQVNPEQKENYMAQERRKRRDFLHKFLNVCSASKVKVDTILIESGMEAKAILDLIPILNIRKLVLGTTKTNLRRMRARRGSGIAAEQIMKDSPEFCEVKIICEGKEMVDLMAESPSPSPRAQKDANQSPQPQKHDEVNNDSFTCCFKPKVVS